MDDIMIMQAYFVYEKKTPVIYHVLACDIQSQLYYKVLTTMQHFILC